MFFEYYLVERIGNKLVDMKVLFMGLEIIENFLSLQNIQYGKYC